MGGSTILRILTAGLCGRNRTQVEGPQPEENLSTIVGEPPPQEEKLGEQCRLTEQEKSYLNSCKNVQEAKRLLTLGQERARALQYLNDFGQDANLQEALLDLRGEDPYRKQLENNDAVSFEQALDLATNPTEVYTLLCIAAKAAIKKYVTPRWDQNKLGHYYKSPEDGKEVHIETTSPYTLYSHLQQFRKEYNEIKRKAGID